MTSADIKLSIIVLCYHGERWIDSCVRSLENQSLSRSLYEIIIVDNGGTTPSVEQYKGRHHVRVVHFLENYGFAGGNNMALEHARGEIIILMNQDVVVHHHCLKELLEAFDCYPEAGVISANMIMVSEKDTINPYSAATETVGHYTLTPLGFASYEVMKTEKDIVSVDFVSGNALGFRKIILKDIGNYLFDSSLGSYMEDLDFTIRLKKTDWQLYVRPKAIIYHFRNEIFSGSLGHMIGKFIHISGNRLMVYYENQTLSGFLKKSPFLLIGIPAKVARLDTETRCHPIRFIAALGLLPLVLLYFGLRVLSKIETAKESQEIFEPPSVERKDWKKIFQIAMFLLFCGIAFLFLYDQDWKNINLIVHKFNWRLISLLIGLTVCSHIVITLRTKLIFHRVGYPTRFSKLLSINLATQFSSVITPAGVGTLLAVPLFKTCFHIPLGHSSLFVIVDRLFGFYFMGCFALVGIFGYMIGYDSAILILFLLFLFLGWVFFRIIRIYDEGIHHFGVPEYGGSLLNLLGSDLPSQLAICLSKLIRYSINIALFLIIARALNYSLDIISGWMIISVSFFAGVISMIPMGIVTRDATILALSSYVGIPASSGLIIILLMRAVTTIPTAILGTGCGLWLWKKHVGRPSFE
jgi:GT2 family glycosyltransferase/uncharacterized membrane protein YbhN (UPF0104 family)